MIIQDTCLYPNITTCMPHCRDMGKNRRTLYLQEKNDFKKSTLELLETWMLARLATIVKSDQGVDFTGKQRQECAKEQGRIWNFYLPYNPTASGNIKWLAQAKA